MHIYIYRSSVNFSTPSRVDTVRGARQHTQCAIREEKLRQTNNDNNGGPKINNEMKVLNQGQSSQLSKQLALVFVARSWPKWARRRLGNWAPPPRADCTSRMQHQRRDCSRRRAIEQQHCTRAMKSAAAVHQRTDAAAANPLATCPNHTKHIGRSLCGAGTTSSGCQALLLQDFGRATGRGTPPPDRPADELDSIQWLNKQTDRKIM
jgi:hypothetical protein